jgi:hypothetical protein
MKTIKQTLLIAFFTIITTFSIKAQDQKYWIYADYVKPAMESEYIQTSKDLVAACKKHNLQTFSWSCVRTDDGIYNFIVPIANMGDIDKDNFGPLGEKMGKENMQLLWDRFDKCVDRNRSYVLTFKKELSYIPNGMPTPNDGENYRKHHYFYVSQSNVKVVTEKIKAITALYTKKNSKVSYRVYRSGFGTTEDYFLVSISAKNEEEYAKNATENNILLGDEWKTLFDDLYKNVTRYDVKTASVQNNLEYTVSK